MSGNEQEDSNFITKVREQKNFGKKKKTNTILGSIEDIDVLKKLHCGGYIYTFYVKRRTFFTKIKRKYDIIKELIH